MSATHDEGTGGGREPLTLERLLLAGIGWASLSADAIERVADDLARRVGADPDEMRGAVRDTAASWRREAERASRHRDEAGEHALRKLGLVRREEHEDLALRVAQLEHRLRLLERDGGQAPAPAPGPTPADPA